MKKVNLIERLWTDSHEKQSPQRFVRYAAMLIMLLTLGVGQMWAASEGSNWNDASSAKVYFDNTNSSYSNVSMLIGRQWAYGELGDYGKKGSWGINFSLVSGTNNLYYASVTAAKYNTFCFINATNWGWEDNNTVTSRLGYCTNTDTPNDNLGSSTHLYVPASGSANASVTHTTPASYTALNYTQTLYQCVAENGGTPAKSTTSIGTISIATKYLSSASSTSNHNASISSGNNSCNTTAARTATVTMTATSITSGYTFLGWYDSETGGTRLEKSTTYTYQATGAKTVYARFSHETTHSVTIYYKCGSTAVASQTSQAIGQVTASSITAPTVYGYTFTGWTLNTGISNQSASTSVNPISVKTLSSGMYNMTANYTEDLTSTWYVSGAAGIFGGWGSSGKNMQRKTGHSAEKRFYYTIDATRVINGETSDSNLEFKIYNSDGASYRGNSGYWVTRSNYQPTLSSESGSNMQFRPDAYGTYEFKVDCESPYSESAPKLTVTFGTKRQVTFGKRTGCKTVTAKYNNTVSMTSGQYVINGSSVTFSQTANEGYTFEGWYNAASGGTRQSTSATYTLTISGGNKIIYPNYTINNHAITHSASSNGTYTIKVGSAAAVSTNTTSDYGKTITLAATPATGYHFESWSAYKTGTPATTVTVSSNQFTMPDYPVTVGATFTPKTYTITLHEQGATTHGTPSDEGTISVTYDATTNLSKITAVPERTGYTFGGYYDTEECDGTWIIKTDTYFNWDGTYLNSTTGKWQYDGNLNLYAKWTANQYTVTLDVDEANKGTIAGATTSQNIYYDDATVTVPNRPTAANGYALDGYYTSPLGEGTKVINADGTWIASVEGYTDADKHWVHADDVTLYAYYKKAEITALTLDAATVESNGTVYVKPTIDPTPTGTTKLSWYILYANGNKLASQPTISGPTDGKYSFRAPEASGMYIIAASLRTGTGSHPYYGGTLLDSTTVNFQVAGTHTVTVRYKCEGEDIKAAAALDGIRPLDWSDEITAPEIIGYRFTDWSAGDGVSLTDDNGTTTKTSTTEADIKIKAIYDGYLTANYSKKRLIYFNNTLGWDNVYVYFYKNGTYWNAKYGTGCNKTYPFTDTPFSEGLYGQMEPIEEGSDIYYFDAEEAGVNAAYQTVVFTELDQHTYNWFSKTGDVKNKVIKRDDYYSTKMPMYVPLAVQTPEAKNGNTADYYWQGYWMNYPANSGYTLKIYNAWNVDNATGAAREIPFPYSEDLKMPLKLNVEFNDAGNHNYWFMIKKNDGNHHGVNYTINQNYNDEQALTSGNDKLKLVTSAPGIYTFTLTYHDNGSGTVNYYIDVDFPVALNDYRIVYKDNATWSNGAHTASWFHPSDVITKIDGEATEAKKDTLSFYISKGEGITPSMKFQYASAINESTGAITWTDVTSGSITIPSAVVTEAGVYNFIVSQPVEGGISVEKVEPYTGDYYIRTDCAGNTKWNSYKNVDHLMTYSDYAEEYSGYSHYYAHWVESGNNVKFTIANDYSMCITDTLVEDYGTTIANISNIGVLNSASANIRFMWNQATNKISRAYISGSTTISDRFLVLEGDAKMFDAEGNALSISGLNANEINLVDDQNFVYEREIKVQTGAKAKLTAKYNTHVQYFKGGAGTAAADSVELLGGNAAGKHSMRIVYDFKTNRLVTAYVPSGTINAAIAINADLMIVREHQGAGQQLLFEGDGALSEVHTVYGVMRFNRWTLNNKEKTGGHSPVGDPKSIYERSLYWISFPFDVKLSDVFGFGTYGVDWIIEYYDGAERATNGYWVDSDGFWKMVMPAQRADFTLEAGKGYVLAIDVDAMKDNNTTFWANNIEQVELFFPSAKNVENITQTTAHTIVPEHECTIDRRTDKSVDNINKDRTKADSHWNMIGIPSYANYGATLTSDEEGTQIIRWNSTPYTNDLPFLYEWNMTDDSYTVQSGTTYPFKAMHAYMVQYHGDLYWSLASATPTPSPIVARRAYAEKPQNAEFRLELQQNEKMVDQTFVNMKDAEEISAGFKFDEDLCKEFNAGKANIYTLIENYLPAAGNTLPMSDQTTLVPVGVKTTAAGEYTFAMPEGTSGVSVVLIDNIAGTRTNLALSDYTVALSKGDLSDRFMLEIAPIKQMPTDIENVQEGDVQGTKVRKVMVDGILYIVKDGKVFDAHGSRVK